MTIGSVTKDAEFRQTSAMVGHGRHVNALDGDGRRPVFTAWDRGILKPGLYASEEAAMAAFERRDHELEELQRRKANASRGELKGCVITLADLDTIGSGEPDRRADCGRR